MNDNITIEHFEILRILFPMITEISTFLLYDKKKSVLFL